MERSRNLQNPRVAKNLLRQTQQPQVPIRHQSRKVILPQKVIKGVFTFFLILAGLSTALPQSRHSSRGTDTEGTVIPVTAWRTDKKADPIKVENLFLYE